MSPTMFRLGLRQCSVNTAWHMTPPSATIGVLPSLRSVSYLTRPSSLAFSRSNPTVSRITRISRILRSQCRQNSTTSQQTVNPADRALNWNSFFKLRKSRRNYSLASSIISGFGGVAGAFIFLSTQPELADEATKLVPIDPIASLGILTVGAGLLGWLIGPVFGNTIWRMLNRSTLSEFTNKEKTFFARIRQHRVNPMGANTNNPVPDFYGEKISSVSGYRQWLKDQRVFNRKREGIYTGGRASGTI